MGRPGNPLLETEPLAWATSTVVTRRACEGEGRAGRTGREARGAERLSRCSRIGNADRSLLSLRAGRKSKREKERERGGEGRGRAGVPSRVMRFVVALFTATCTTRGCRGSVPPTFSPTRSLSAIRLVARCHIRAVDVVENTTSFRFSHQD